jgi:hypothetical protein
MIGNAGLVALSGVLSRQAARPSPRAQKAPAPVGRGLRSFRADAQKSLVVAVDALVALVPLLGLDRQRGDRAGFEAL